MKPHIDGKDATRVAAEAAKRGPIRVHAAQTQDVASPGAPPPPAPLAVHTDGRKAPPRLRKLSPHNDQCVAPTSHFESHRARLREVFGNTLSDEFVEVLLGKLMEALRPNPLDKLEEPTLNGALALITSIQPRSEMEALIAVQIVATGLSGLRFLRQSQHHMSEDFIEVYGGYAIKLLKLQTELLQALDRHRRGHHQTVEVHHVHLYPGSQGVIGVVNSSHSEGEAQKS
ncbi:MAG TPA: hypothetical protein VEO53_13710 [Candidatus Binatia bacterium]|jgi:hypothetical protein|nr:hypothetical protein [Candidatus Binatia bacterium]